MTDGVRIAPFGDAAVLVELRGVDGIAAARRARAVAAAIEAIRREVPALGVPVPAATSVLVPFDPRAIGVEDVEARLAEVVERTPADGRSANGRARPRAGGPLRRRRRPRPRGGRRGGRPLAPPTSSSSTPRRPTRSCSSASRPASRTSASSRRRSSSPGSRRPRPRVPAGQRRHRRADDRRLSPRLARRLAAARPDRRAAVRSRLRRRRPASVPATASGSCRPDVATRRPSSRSSTRACSCRSRTAGDRASAAEGVTRGGAADRYSLAVANALVGNPPDAAALEATLLGPTVRALARGHARRSRARWRDASTETGERVVPGSTVTLRAGDTLALEPATGARGYLAVPGGIDVPVVLGSRSTALGAGLRRARWTRAPGRRSTGADWQDRAIPHAHWPGAPAPVAVSATEPAPRACPARMPRTSARTRSTRSSRRPGPSARRATAWGSASTATRSPAPRPRSSRRTASSPARSSSRRTGGPSSSSSTTSRPAATRSSRSSSAPTSTASASSRRVRPCGSSDRHATRPERHSCAQDERLRRGHSPSSATPLAGTTCGGAPAPDASRATPSAASLPDRSCKGPAMARSAGRGQTCAR